MEFRFGGKDTEKLIKDLENEFDIMTKVPSPFLPFDHIPPSLLPALSFSLSLCYVILSLLFLIHLPF